MEQQKTTMSVVPQKRETKIKLKYNYIPCLCWFFGILFSFVPMIVEYANDFINEENPNLYLTLFGNKEIFFICVSFSIAILFYIMEKKSANTKEKTVDIILYIAFAFLLFVTVSCIGVYVKQSTSELALFNDVIAAIERDVSKEQLISELTLKAQSTVAKDRNIANLGVVAFSASCLVGLISFLDIKRS